MFYIKAKEANTEGSDAHLDLGKYDCSILTALSKRVAILSVDRN